MNLVDCKLCKKEFDYSPGVAGNARQICDTCRDMVDEEELAQLEEETIKEGNRYLCENPVYDPVEILMEGNIPELDNDGDRYICATEMAQFVRKTGISGLEEGIVGYIKILTDYHRILFLKQLKLSQVEMLIRYCEKNYPEMVKDTMSIVVG